MAVGPQYPLQPINGITGNSNVVYLDLSISYSLDQSQITVANSDAIKVKIVNILYTFLGSRPFEPEFGSLVPTLIFSNIKPNSQQSYKIESEIYASLRKWLSSIINVNISGINVIPVPNESAYFISVSYTVYGLTTPQNLSLRYSQ